MDPPGDQTERFVKTIFDRISWRYDLLNRVISLHLDTLWRKQAVNALGLNRADRLVLDLGTGTGDLAFSVAREIGERGKVYGLDFSPRMLRLAQEKKQKLRYGDRTVFILGSALAPPFQEEAFDVVITAFVLRNLADLNLFFLQAYRLLRPGGRLGSLDMFPPTPGPFSYLYSLYFYRLVPWVGGRLSRDRVAYQYLSDSVRGFGPPESVADKIRKAGFQGVVIRKFLRGAVCLHLAEKPRRQ